MAEKVLKTKIALLYKSAAEWDAIQDSYKPLKGEVCFCEVPSNSEKEGAVLFKVGNGIDVFRDLPWGSALAADVFAWAKKENLDFSDLDQNFLDAMMEYIGGSEENTIFRLAEDENNVVKLQKSDDGGTHWSDVQNSAEIDLGAINAAIEDVAGDLADEISRAEAAENDLSDAIAAEQARAEAVEEDLQDKIDALGNALHFIGATNKEEGETDEEAIERLLEEKGHVAEAGDVVIIDAAEYIYDGEEWKSLGDESLYATKAALQAEVERAEGAEEALDAKVDAEQARAEAKEQELEERLDILDLPQEPELIDNVLYANGVSLRIVDDGAQNVAHYRTSHVEDHTIEFPYNSTVYGGAKGTAEHTYHFESSNIVIDGAKLHSVFGGCQDFGDVAVANIIMHKGTIANSLMGGPNSFAAGANAAVGEANIKVFDGEIFMIYGGPASNTSVGKTNVEFHGGHVQYLTVGGSNGETLSGKLVVDGGVVDLLQTVNRGFIEDVKVVINGGEVKKMYAGGETEDAGVTGKAEHVNLQILEGEVKALHKGSYAGVEDASRCSGDFNAWTVNKAQAEACNLVENELILNCNL